MIKIAPSLLAANYNILKKELLLLEKAKADMLHIDIMDGHFVPNLSMGPDMIKTLRKESKLFFDCHLMVEYPENFIEPFSSAGVDHITIHQESQGNIKDILKKIKSLNKTCGISIKPNTSAQDIFPYLDIVDLVLVMTVEPGFGGQKFMDLSTKIKEIKNEIDHKNLSVNIQVDGGINFSTAPIVTNAGANILVSGSALFSQKNYKKAIKKLKI